MIPFQVLNLRLKGIQQGEGGGFDFGSLYYLSIHTLDNASGNAYAKSRVGREVLDQWLAKRIQFSGQAFDDSDVTLTEKDSSCECCMLSCCDVVFSPVFMLCHFLLSC